MFYPNRSSIFRDLGRVFPLISVCFSSVFSGADFGAMQWKHRVLFKIQHFRGLWCACCTPKKLVFRVKIGAHENSDLNITFMTFSWNRHHSHTGATILEGSRAKNSCNIYLFVVICFSVFFVFFLCAFLTKTHVCRNPSFCPNKTHFSACTGSVFFLFKMS